MANPLRDFFFGTVTGAPKRELADALVPRRSFADVILPATTRRQLEYALTQIKKHDLIFGAWGLGERHTTGMGLAFNFAGPPGTGKTICAEAIAHDLNKNLFVVRYAEMESLWAGETSKNVATVFRAARESDSVLFFDEADAIATRRFGSVTQGYQREANAVVNVLLKELEEFDGVVIFATNLASNFDPAFERRIRTHILFDMPDADAREAIWKVQLHARKTPLAEDVDFAELARKYVVAGGDIKNAVLKAAQIASIEPGPDNEKRIHQKHFVSGIEDVIGAKKVMEQSIIEGDGSARPQIAPDVMSGISQAFTQLAGNQNSMGEDLQGLIEKSNALEQGLNSIPTILGQLDEQNKGAARELKVEMNDQLSGQNREIASRFGELKAEIARGEENIKNLIAQTRAALVLGGVGLLAAIGAGVAAYFN